MDIYKILSELDERVESKMQPTVKNFEDNKDLTHLELSNMFFDFQWNQKRNIISGTIYDILLEQGIDSNNLKTLDEIKEADIIDKIVYGQIEKLIDNIYHSKIKIIVFRGKDRTFL